MFKIAYYSNLGKKKNHAENINLHLLQERRVLNNKRSTPLRQNLKLSKKLTLNLISCAGMFFRVSFRFWLSVYFAGQKYRWFIFLVVPVLIQCLLQQIHESSLRVLWWFKLLLLWLYIATFQGCTLFHPPVTPLPSVFSVVSTLLRTC